jgi:glycine betaine/proline transport system substrate-binding protein
MHAKTARSRVTAALVLLALLVGGAAHAQAPDCGGVSRPIVFAEVDWDSVQVINGIARTILELGFGCVTDAIPGSTAPLLQGAIRGDVDVTMEVWLDNSADIWDPAVAAGTVEQLGVMFDDAVQAWYVPRYVVEGDPERGIEPLAPDLRSVFDLPRYAELFRDPEQPDLGRFHNCIIGWQCELINTAKLHAYGLTEHFTNFNPGTSVALASSMEGAYLRGEPWLGYYWAPTWVLGKLDMLRLEEPPYSDACWARMVALIEAGTPELLEDACAYPASTVVVGLGSRFKDEVSPEIKAFLNAMEMPSDRVGALLAFMQDTDAGPMAAARAFLHEQPEVWSAWLDDETAARVRAGLE